MGMGAWGRETEDRCAERQKTEEKSRQRTAVPSIELEHEKSSLDGE
jgi:hypothetical protein